MLESSARAASFRLSFLALSFGLGGCGGGGGGGAAAPTLSAPSTGAVWGGTNSIVWTAGTTSGGSARILLSDDGGATFMTELAAATPDDGAFSLDTSALTDDEDYRVRVILSNGTTLTSGDFAVDNTAPVTSLTSPVGSEVLGGAATVTWTTTDAHPGTVEIRLSDDDGATYDEVIAASTPDDGVYEWSSSTLVDGVQYRLQVVATDAAANEGTPSRSPQSFELDNTPPVIVLTSPSGSESWSRRQTITWTTTETNPSTVQLALSADGGGTFATTIAAAAPDTGSYAWETGEVPDGTLLRVRAIAVDMAGNASAPSTSAANFTATNLRILAPAHYLDLNQDAVINGGDQLLLYFDKQVTVNSTSVASLLAPVSGDTFGTGATVGAGSESDSVVITLGATPTLRTRGTFAIDDVASARPSGLDIETNMAANAIEQAGTGLDAAPSGWKDLQPTLVPMALGLSTTGTPAAAAAGDFDRDGDLDLVIAESTGQGTHILLGAGNGTFSSNGVLGAVAATDIAVGDVDGDGALDHVIAASAGALIAIGDGNGGFAAYGSAVGAGPTAAVALADFDCDGDLDLFLGNGSGTADTVFLNDGAGTFADSGQSLGAASTSALAVGDLDGDGDLDVITAVGTGGQPVRAWLNDGAATFAVGDSLTVTAAQDVVLGDLDGDGDLDAVVAVLGQNEILKNDGAGAFGATFQRFGNNDNRAAALIDLDGDGDLDIVTVKNADSERLWFNDGTGTVTESRRRGLSDDSVAVVAARLDGDSDLDLVVIVDGAPHRAYFGSASGGQPDADFAGAGTSTAAVAARSGAAGDIDGDGDIDVVLSGVSGGATIMENDGAGTFAIGASFGPDGATVVALVDVDCDGDVDALLRDPVAVFGVDLWLNDGGGVFSAGPTGLADPLSGFADANGDGALDFVGSDILGAPALFLGDGSGGFTDSGADLGVGPGLQAVIGRFDGDAVLDVAVLEAGTVRVALGAGDGVTDSTEQIMFVNSDGMVADDFDRDGDLDLVGFAGSSGRLEPYRNDLPAGFTTLALTGAIRDYDGVTLYDHDEDGFLDVFTWAEAPVATTAVFRGDGSGGYSAAAAGGVTNLQQALLADFDGDGDEDVFQICYDTVGSTAAQHVLVLRD